MNDGAMDWGNDGTMDRNRTAWYGVEWKDDGIDEWPLRPPTARGPNEWHSGLSGESRYSDYPPMSSPPTHLLKSNRLRNFHILGKGSKKIKEEICCISSNCPFGPNFLLFLQILRITITKIYELEFPFLGTKDNEALLNNWIAWLTALWADDSTNLILQQTEAQMHSGIYRRINYERSEQCNFIDLDAFHTFSWYFRVFELPVKHKYESFPRIRIDNSDSSDRVIEKYWSMKVKKHLWQPAFGFFHRSCKW